MTPGKNIENAPSFYLLLLEFIEFRSLLYDALQPNARLPHPCYASVTEKPLRNQSNSSFSRSKEHKNRNSLSFTW